jgi:PIN domain nuclease of toxin-antitoxin system
MPGVLLDTHILLWWLSESGKLTKPHFHLLSDLEKRGEPAAVSAITLWELAKMVELGRLDIDQSLDLWLEEIENHPLLFVVPITARIAAESVRLGGGFHKDPADQIIVATARCLNLRLLTADERIRKWGKVLLA